MLALVQATLNGREYTHYACKQRSEADRLAAILCERRPHLLPITVVDWQPTPEQERRISVYADESPGPK